MCLAVTGCRQRQTTLNKKKADHLDSLMYAIYDARYQDPEHALTMTDSLIATGDLTVNMADECRAEIYDAKGQSRLASFYAEKSLKDGKLYQEDPPSFYAAYRLLSHIYINALNWKKALEYATDGKDFARRDTSFLGRLYEPKFLSQIGSCQIMLGRTAEGNSSFRAAYETMKANAVSRNNFDAYYNMLTTIGNCIESNLMKDQTEQALAWLPHLQESYDKSLSAEDAKEEFVNYARQCLEANTALVLAKSGRAEEAEQHYQTLLSISSEDDNDYLGSQINYLKTTKQWTQLADLAERADLSRQSKENTLSLDFLRLELVPMFEAEMKSGHSAKALGTAERIIQSIDSVYIKTQRDDAAELAVVFETQEKEAKIKEQQTELARQRLWAVGIALLLLITFLAVLLLQHRHSARRLAGKNQELEQKNAELSVANARAEESSKMKSNFIQQISHEIRTPLNILSGFTQIVTTPGMQLDEATKSDINRQITENTDRITGLVNKMLELSDANSRSVIERTDEVMALQLAAQAAEASGITQAQHLDFNIEAAEGTDALTIHTNQQQAARALTLLLDNARKFTRQAEAHHRNETVAQKKSAVLRISLSDNMVCYTIEDTGIGVPPEEAERIFDEFVQLDEYYDGTGIGLTVARSIVRRLGGDVYLDTNYTNGARFIMTLPLE